MHAVTIFLFGNIPPQDFFGDLSFENLALTCFALNRLAVIRTDKGFFSCGMSWLWWHMLFILLVVIVLQPHSWPNLIDLLAIILDMFITVTDLPTLPIPAFIRQN